MQGISLLSQKLGSSGTDKGEPKLPEDLKHEEVNRELRKMQKLLNTGNNCILYHQTN